MTVIIGVISDTHIVGSAGQLPRALQEALAGVDMIIHCGDVCSLQLLQELSKTAPLVAAAGNLDPDAVREKYGTEHLLDLEGWRIGVTHGHLGPGRNATERSHRAFAGRGVDVVIYGHSHHPMLERQGGMLMFNPGSPTRRRREPRYSYGLLILAPRTLRATLVFFDTPNS